MLSGIGEKEHLQEKEIIGLYGARADADGDYRDTDDPAVWDCVSREGLPCHADGA